MSDGLTEALKQDTDPLSQLILRGETGYTRGDDAQIFFYALKHAAEKHADKPDMLKFLRYHLEAAKEYVRSLPVEH